MRSQAKLGMFFAVILVPLLVLSLGPMRGYFFPPHYTSLATLVDLSVPTLVAPAFPPELLEREPALAKALQSEDYESIGTWLDRTDLGHQPETVLWLVQNLLRQRRPGPALLRLERLPADINRSEDARWLRSQAMLLLGRGAETAALLRPLATESTSYGERARGQLAAVQRVQES